jgi:hypothetical protein
MVLTAAQKCAPCLGVRCSSAYSSPSNSSASNTCTAEWPITPLLWHTNQAKTLHINVPIPQLTCRYEQATV